MTNMEKNRFSGRTIGLLVTLLLFAGVAAVGLYGLRGTSAAAAREGLAATEDSIRSAVVECYALEGAYPPDLDYLEAHYGIHVDTSRYYVYYSAQGQNILPQITVGAYRK